MSSKVLLPNTERLARLLQEELTNWENDFCRSLLGQCTKASFDSFSPKQEDKLRSIEHDYGMNRMDDGSPRIYQQSSCTTAAIKSAYIAGIPPTPFTSNKLPQHSFDDTDDDIPL